MIKESWLHHRYKVGRKSGGGNYGFQFDSDGRFYLVAGGQVEFKNRKLRFNAWYHVAKCDTHKDSINRFKLYINGVRASFEQQHIQTK